MTRSRAESKRLEGGYPPDEPAQDRTAETDTEMSPVDSFSQAERHLRDGYGHHRAGRIADAHRCYEAAFEAAEKHDEKPVLAQALRRLSVIHHLRNEPAEAKDRCERSRQIAQQIGDRRLEAKALNALASFDLETGQLDTAGRTFRRALLLTGKDPLLRGRIEQNLGVLENIQGNYTRALEHYSRSLSAFGESDDQRSCAIAYHNLGMISADTARWDDADRYFRHAADIATTLGDVQLRALCLVNHSEVFLARQDYAGARQLAEAALPLFDQIGHIAGKSSAYRFLGMIYRETGANPLAEARLRLAIELAVEANSPLEEAEGYRELAVLYQRQGRNLETLEALNKSRRLFRQLHANLDRAHIVAKIGELEQTFLKVVREWGESMESADRYTHGHCERVASYAVRVAQALGLNETEQTTIRVGAYLHDLGKVNVPHEILNKAGPLTDEEFEVIKKHPLWGIELLTSIKFPWDIKPIIRWHHEKVDGSGYPDGLTGGEIPLAAQIICIADTFDAITTERHYRTAMSWDEAFAELHRCRHWWFPEVFEAFVTSMRDDDTARDETIRTDGRDAS